MGNRPCDDPGCRAIPQRHLIRGGRAADHRRSAGAEWRVWFADRGRGRHWRARESTRPDGGAGSSGRGRRAPTDDADFAKGQGEKDCTTSPGANPAQPCRKAAHANGGPLDDGAAPY